MKAGVCYYPEHWPSSMWQDDARRMREMGISVVRIGEFAWSRLQPSREQFNFQWLEDAIDILHAAGLEVVMGTPTATPPKWLIDEYPEILAVDENGRTRGFGSRRHYCFSSQQYRRECAGIVTEVARHLGHHPAVTAWQTDNEYGCHSTIASYSSNALSAFQSWCRDTYADISTLNAAWGNVFWSMEYRSFDEIPLPCGAVTEMNPAHRLAFWRFSSDQVVSFNKLQVDILRRLSPGRDILHNYMGNFTEFDHHAVGADLDIASWDNYPLGFLDRDGSNAADQQKWYRTGHPDSSAFHHDLYRGVGNGRWWVIEQQPGPVNWAPHNPAPLDGMVRLWGWEAYAHGAEVMAWFRWRQAPFAQEQMHTGLLLPNGDEDTAVAEVRQLMAEIASLPSAASAPSTPSAVAMLFDYSGDQMLRIQPQGENFNIGDWTQSLYTACRQSGVNIDIVSPDTDLNDYAMVILSNSVAPDAATVERLQQYAGTILIGPRCGSKSAEYSIPDNLPPGPLQTLIPIRISRVESLPDFVAIETGTDSHRYTVCRWREKITSELRPAAECADGWGFHYQHNRVHYLNACLDQPSLNRFLKNLLQQSGIATTDCHDGLRIRQRGPLTFAFNYGPDATQLPTGQPLLTGSSPLAAGQVAIWHTASQPAL